MIREEWFFLVKSHARLCTFVYTIPENAIATSCHLNDDNLS